MSTVTSEQQLLINYCFLKSDNGEIVLGLFLPLFHVSQQVGHNWPVCRKIKHVDETASILSSLVLLSSVQAVCSSETLIRSTQPFVWPSSCTTPVQMPRKPRSTWCLTWTTSRRPTASQSPTPVSHVSICCSHCWTPRSGHKMNTTGWSDHRFPALIW